MQLYIKVAALVAHHRATLAALVDACPDFATRGKPLHFLHQHAGCISFAAKLRHLRKELRLSSDGGAVFSFMLQR